MPQQATQQWNPVEAFHSKWPDTGLSDQEILTNLQKPAKFRSAFPEYTGVTDDEIRTRMAAYLGTKASPQGRDGQQGKGTLRLSSGDNYYNIPRHLAGEFNKDPNPAKWSQYAETSFTQPVTDTVSQYHPGIMDRVRSAFPIIGRVEQGLSGPAQTTAQALAKPRPEMSDERAVAPEQAMTQEERQAHPILTGAGEFAGGMTTPENALLTAGTAVAPGALAAKLPGWLPDALAGREVAVPVARAMGGFFSAQMLRGAYQEFPAFRDAVNRQDWSEVERIGTHMVLGATMAGLGAVQVAKGESPYERYNEAGRDFAKLKRQSQTKAGIETNGVGLYNKIQQDLITHQEALRNDGARTIQGAIDADKAALMNTNRGSISTSGAVAEASKALDKTDYSLKPAERGLLNRIVNQPELTLEDAKQIRTAFGRAMTSAGRRGDAAGKAVFTAAYNELGEGMKSRIQELQGTTRPYEHYNNQFRASFELEDGIAGDMMKSLRGQDAHASIPKLKDFANANISEIQQQMRKIGLHEQAKSLEGAQRDAKALVDGHEAVNGKYLQSVYRLFLQHPSQAWPGLAVMAAGHGIGLPFPVPQIMGTAFAAPLLRARALRGAMKAGTRLQSELPEESFNTRTQAEEPETFTYKNPDEGWNTPPAPTETLSPQAKAAAVKAAKASRTSASPESRSSSPPAEASGGPSSGLPSDLRGSKPRYGYRDKLFTLKFEDPHDLALYTVAQETPNKAHDRFMSWLQNEYPGKSEGELIAMGKEVRARIKANARDADADAGPLTVPATGSTSRAAKAAAIKAAKRTRQGRPQQ